MNLQKLFLLVGLSAALVGCSSTPKAPPKPNPSKINWSERVGNYTYEQALADLGKPAVSGESNEGRFAEWVLHRSSRMSFGFGVGTGSFGPRGGVGVGAGSSVSPPPSGEYLQLKFCADGKLKDWSKVRY
ncbi:MAG: hypothetical protein QOF48_2507 [Verrucomicrobiota bacterium]|jgi:hypothetical protein